jgi:hypothetical protein
MTTPTDFANSLLTSEHGYVEHTFSPHVSLAARSKVVLPSEVVFILYVNVQGVGLTFTESSSLHRDLSTVHDFGTQAADVLRKRGHRVAWLTENPT